MTLQEEALIEAFALDPAKLSTDESEQAISLIGSDAKAAAQYAYLDRFYRGFERTAGAAMSTQLDGFIKRLLEVPSALILRPRRTVLRDSRTGTVSTPRIAASTKLHRAFELLGSNISDDGLTNVRFIQDHETARVRIYVVSSLDLLRQNALLLFQGSSCLLMTDQTGQASIERDLFDQLGLLERSVLLRPLCHEFSVSVPDLGEACSDVGTHSMAVSASNKAGKLCLSFRPEDGVLFGQTTTSDIWKHVPPETCIEEIEHRNQLVSFRMYV